ncbi:ABC transporter ATP-binding protein [Spiroplasma endosymbiont of Panorpa germanica]|uniref:ABC transporter ATP-binding protein n=1 Tax=Spiroplasma endosymbiont of Panorpa germanica TaxID=3066314 RepID=UPI0030D3BDC9
MLEIKNITKLFKNGAGIKNVSFQIPEKSICGFVGDNGMGKTTTIRCIFQEYQTSQGEVTYKGKTLKSRNNLIKIGLFPDTNSIPLDYQLKDYVTYLALLYKIPPKVAIEKLSELTKIFNLEGYENKKLKTLSAGMLKRAMLLAIMILDLEVIILDEPTANLDVNSRQEFMEILLFLNSQGKTIIITSHIIEELQEIIDFLVFIDNGEIKYSKPIDNKKESIKEIYNKYRSQNISTRVGDLKKYVKSSQEK